jgi:hypothetical protein
MNKIFAFVRAVRSAADHLAYRPWTLLIAFVAGVVAVETVRRL